MIKNHTGDHMQAMYEKFKDSFTTSLHSTLWHFFIDWKHEKQHCFVAVYTINGLILGIATEGESGYTPTLSYFPNGTTWDKAQEIADEMNAEVIGIDKERAVDIVASSMAEAISKTKPRKYEK